MTSNDKNPTPVPVTHAILLGEDLEHDCEVLQVLRDRFQLQASWMPHLNSNGELTTEFKPFLAREDVVLVLSNFEGRDFRPINDACRVEGFHYRLISSHLVKVMASQEVPLPILRDKRPIYCLFMSGMTFALDLKKYETRRTVDLIHYMNGVVRKRFSPQLTLISNEARGDPYRTVVSLGEKVLRTEFVEKCWEQRNDPNFGPIQLEEYRKLYRLKCFGGLSLYFHGFNETEMKEFTVKTSENGGTVVKNLDEATHIVINNGENETSEKFYQLGASNSAEFVTSQWFWKSVHIEFNQNEGLFHPFKAKENNAAIPTTNARLNKSRSRRSHLSPGSEVIAAKSRKSNSRTTLETSNISSDYGLSEDSLDNLAQPVDKKNSKRKQILMEMLSTEQNYVDDLGILLSMFKEPLDRQANAFISSSGEHHQPPMSPSPFLSSSSMISKRDINAIFGKIQPIYRIHQNILESLKTVVRNEETSSGTSEPGIVWATRSPELLKVYPPYVNDYDNIIQTFDSCLARCNKFHTFIKSIESDPRCKRRSVKDLLIKPVQRLPSVVLLLEQLKKKTDKHHKDYKGLVTAIANIQNVLKCTNNSRRQLESFENVLMICDQIEGFPDSLRSSKRTLQKTIEMQILSGDGFFQKFAGKSITIFLFDDFVALTKLRSNANANPNVTQTSFYGRSGRGTLARQLSFLHPPRFRERKKYKLIQVLRVPDFRLIRYTLDGEMFTIKVRNEESEYLFAGQPSGDATFQDMYDFFGLLCECSKKCDKELRMEELTQDAMVQLRNSSNEDFFVIERALCCVRRDQNSSKRQSTLRRTVSNISLGIQHGFQRFTNRANLSFIYESSV